MSTASDTFSDRLCQAEFFSLAYPRQPSHGTTAAVKLRELLQTLQPPPPPPKPAETLDEAKLEEMLKATLERMMRGSGGSA